MEQKKLKMNNQKFCRILSFVVALLIIINVALMIASNMLASTLDTYLGKGHLVKESPNGTESWDTSYYDVKYQNNKESTEAAYEVAAQVMQEGTVLLKNNGILPLADGSTVTPFGRAYLDPIYGQLTSGGSAKWVVDPVSPEQALSSVYTLNNAAVDMSKSSSFPFAPVIAATWNVDLLYNVGAAFGQESLQNGVNGWYCPAINLHRSPFSGRVFEYYSEDPILSGKLAAACISGAGDQGMVCYLKHFALNDTETNRSQLCTTWATEQTMRDIYMKAFEIAVEEARMTVKYTADENGTTATRVMRATTGIMPAQNSVGDCLGTCNYNLLNNVLRKEWGFRGMVITDYWIWGDNNLRDLCIRTGSDAYLCMSMPAMWNLNDYDSATARWAMRNAIHNISYALANSNATQDSAPGTTFRMSTSPWKIAANAAIVVIWVLVVALIVLMVRRTKDAKLHPENYKPRKQKKVKA